MSLLDLLPKEIKEVIFDYKNKIISFGPLIYPSGNLNADIEDMQLFFENIRGKKSQ